MHLPVSITLLLLLPLTTGTPLSAPRDPPPFSYRTVTLSLTGGPASYAFSFPADGNTYAPSPLNPLAVSQIVSEDFNIFYSCNFYFAPGPGDGPPRVLTSNPPGNEVAVGPPGAVTGVACQPTPGGRGQYCLPDYATCEWCGGSNGLGGCRVLQCCSGYCAATKCRPTH